MPRPRHDPDPNSSVARVIAETAGAPDELPAEPEAAWKAWRACIQNVDARTWTLLRAAFDAGVGVGRRAKRG